jgi:putative effector of murein hydrolase LrgA (UPF0299 family)
MIAALAVVLACQLAGEAVVRGLGLPLPGPVLGLVLLFAALAARERLRPPPPEASDPLVGTCRALLANLSLLFVPAGVGVVQSLDLVAAHGAAVAVALAVSTLAALVASVAAFRIVARWTHGGRAGDSR